MFSCEYCQISKSTFSYRTSLWILRNLWKQIFKKGIRNYKKEHMWTAAPGIIQKNSQMFSNTIIPKKLTRCPRQHLPQSSFFGQLVKFTIKVLYEQRFQNFPEQLLCRTSVSSDPAETYLEPSGASVMEFFCKSSKIVFRR